MAGDSLPLISCLQATYGRHSLVERSLACFFRQDYPNAELIILNNHAVPMRLDPAVPPDLAAKIRVVNEPCYATLGACRNRLLDLASGDLIRTWDDDDIYLPWSISQGVEGLMAAEELDYSTVAWKPEKSWWTNGGKHFELAGNAMEASITIDTEITRKYRYRESGGDEHSPLLAGLQAEGGIATDGDSPSGPLGIWTGYCYTWGCNGGHHISGTLGAKGTGNPSADLATRTRNWMTAHRDTPRRPLTPDYAAADDWYGRISLYTGADQAEFTRRCRGERPGPAEGTPNPARIAPPAWLIR